MLERHLNQYHPEFKSFAKIMTPSTVATMAASLLGKVDFTEAEAMKAIDESINLLIAADHVVRLKLTPNEPR
jgi:hypothetical protein